MNILYWKNRDTKSKDKNFPFTFGFKAEIGKKEQKKCTKNNVIKFKKIRKCRKHKYFKK